MSKISLVSLLIIGFLLSVISVYSGSPPPPPPPICTPGESQCVSLNFQVCGSDFQWYDAGIDMDIDGVDRQCGDDLCDHETQYADATRLGSESENCLDVDCIGCEDGYDNDCDGFYDCADSDCKTANISGTITDSDGVSLFDATVTLYNTSLDSLDKVVSDADGFYSFGGLCGNYVLVASKESHAPGIEESILAPAFSRNTLLFILPEADGCEQDCTLISDGQIHSECAGINGCSFFDGIAAAICTNAKPGWLRDYNLSHTLVCPSGIPTVRKQVAATVSCSGDDLIKQSKIVLYQGKLVKLTAAVCG